MKIKKLKETPRKVLEFPLDNDLNLTEKEVNLILYLRSSTEPVKVKTLQQEVWGYRNSLETHTVETHIHRLRKKILSTFNLDDLIVSKKDVYYL